MSSKFPVEAMVDGKIFFSCIILLVLSFSVVAVGPPNLSIQRLPGRYDVSESSPSVVYFSVKEECDLDFPFSENLLYMDLYVDGVLYENRSHLVLGRQIMDAYVPPNASLSMQVHTVFGGLSNSVLIPNERVFIDTSSSEPMGLYFLLSRSRVDCGSAFTSSIIVAGSANTTSIIVAPTEPVTPRDSPSINFLYAAAAAVLLLAFLYFFFRGGGLRKGSPKEGYLSKTGMKLIVFMVSLLVVTGFIISSSDFSELSYYLSSISMGGFVAAQDGDYVPPQTCETDFWPTVNETCVYEADGLIHGNNCDCTNNPDGMTYTGSCGDTVCGYPHCGGPDGKAQLGWWCNLGSNDPFCIEMGAMSCMGEEECGRSNDTDLAGGPSAASPPQDVWKVNHHCEVKNVSGVTSTHCVYDVGQTCPPCSGCDDLGGYSYPAEVIDCRYTDSCEQVYTCTGGNLSGAGHCNPMPCGSPCQSGNCIVRGTAPNTYYSCETVAENLEAADPDGCEYQCAADTCEGSPSMAALYCSSKCIDDDPPSIILSGTSRGSGMSIGIFDVSPPCGGWGAVYGECCCRGPVYCNSTFTADDD
ncbi:hypothetical protein KKC44_06495, partial [Patescibacteria group bacterium]|nr:hypothetical protein [Patescibacteria group bacterium]